jgi:predicted DCC family thiol-disulfide oxidoreductase YuxK
MRTYDPLDSSQARPKFLISKLFGLLFPLSMASPGARHVHVVLFDGVCGLCDGTMKFIIERDRNHRLKFASLQSRAGKHLLGQYGIHIADDLSSMLYIDGAGKMHRKSTALLKVAEELPFPYPIFAAVGRVVPTCVRDSIYDMIGQHRYEWFGRTKLGSTALDVARRFDGFTAEEDELCLLPTKGTLARFLDAEETLATLRERRRQAEAILTRGGTEELHKKSATDGLKAHSPNDSDKKTPNDNATRRSHS